MARNGKFLFGAVLGALFGLAFAPKKGAELRKELKKEIEKGGHGEKTLKKTAGQIGQDIVETGKEVYNDPTVQKQIKQGKKEVAKLAEQAQKKLQESSEEWVKIARDKIVEGGKTVGQETAKAIDTLKKKTAATSHKPTRPAFKSSATVSKPAPAKKAPAKAKASKKSAKK
jgi:gas vesicle protein